MAEGEGRKKTVLRVKTHEDPNHTARGINQPRSPLLRGDSNNSRNVTKIPDFNPNDGGRPSSQFVTIDLDQAKDAMGEGHNPSSQSHTPMNRSQTDSKEGFEFDGLSDRSFIDNNQSANEYARYQRVTQPAKHKINVNRRISIRPRPPR